MRGRGTPEATAPFSLSPPFKMNARKRRAYLLKRLVFLTSAARGHLFSSPFVFVRGRGGREGHFSELLRVPSETPRLVDVDSCAWAWGWGALLSWSLTPVRENKTFKNEGCGL